MPKGIKGFSKLSKHYNWQGGMVEINCYICNKIFKVKRYRKFIAKTCSKFCFGKLHSIKINGSNNPNWRGGITEEDYPKLFNNKLKYNIRKRDNQICQKCFKHDEDELKDFNRTLAIHHIDYNKNNCKESNLITLCCKCNAFVNFNRGYWKIYFQKIINKLSRYSSVYQYE